MICVIIYLEETTVLQGGKSPSFLTAVIAAVPLGMIPSWEIRKEGGGAYEYI